MLKSTDIIYSGVLLSVLTATSAFAQDASQAAAPEAAIASQDGNEIIVTARRKNEALQSVPIAITAMSGEALAKARTTNLQDIAKLAPSVNIGSSSRGASVPYLSIRGISTADIVSTVDPSIGVYLNEVVAGRPNGVLSSMYDIESVQVLRGPQGTLFGRNTTGGAILISTVKPKDVFEGYGRVSVGNYALVTAEGAVNIPLASGVALRVAGRVNSRNGYVRSVTTGQDLGNLDDQSFRASLKIDLSDAIETTTVATYFNTNTNGSASVPAGPYPAGVLNPAGGTTARISATSNIADADNLVAAKAARAVNDANFYRTASDTQIDTAKTFDISNTTVFRLSDDFTLKNIFGYRNVKAFTRYDVDGTAARLLETNTDTHIHQISEEIQGQGTLGKVEYVLGGYYFRESGTQFGNVFAGVPFARRTTPASSANTGGPARNSSESIFANLGYPITPRLKATAGLRYTWDQRHADLQSVTLFNPESANPTSSCAVGDLVSFTPAASSASGIDEYTIAAASPCSVPRNAKSKQATYSVDLTWRPTDTVTLYAAHRHGYHSSALNARASFETPGNGDSAKPEKIDDVEVGIKSSFNIGDVRARVNVAGYYGWLKDVQRPTSLQVKLTVTNPGQPTTSSVRFLSAFINAAKAHMSGVELEYGLSYKGFELNGFYAYNNTKYDNFINPGTGIDYTFERFTYAPRHTVGATARYEVPLGQGPTEAAVQLSYFHTSSFATTIEGQPLLAIVPAYGLLNGRIELNDIGYKGVSLAVFGNNLLKKKYYTGGANSYAVGAASFVAGAPRMYGAELSWRF